MANNNFYNSKQYFIDEYEYVINRIYRSYSVSKSFLPKNFVPILKPKKCVFEEVIPFSLQLSNQSIENEEVKTNDSYSNNIQDVKKDNNDDHYKREKSLSFDNHVNNKKKHIRTILGKLKEKHLLKDKE